MKQIKAPFSHTGPNGLGRNSTTTREHLEIEKSDIGVKREHFRGYKYSAHVFTARDVGQVIEVITDGTGYTCWYFMQHHV